MLFQYVTWGLIPSRPTSPRLWLLMLHYNLGVTPTTPRACKMQVLNLLAS